MRNDFFTVILMVLAIFGYSGWYFAEFDNETLRQELSSYMGKEVRK